ncbi:MAG: 2-oxoglutarate dehydrogenase complex dihydrolipoyllysine-residue succinyltransferase [Oceanospirillaceae bacterium]|jgi:2-oxoglutarate dehydrogenase E2 component (dihydrolipoamide succinyltransferase)|nr:2-oxoglutarate dehydrogenase complex dihydrolipoyllysine-residue succinyltransferase [Oceanospirillaceae bacterium]MBT4442055.1 2-oxoglutarate dehydrogenase complex dihydrolipoyllysine-residue succinyltransferase [Oceanospirillaceae bacterium]
MSIEIKAPSFPESVADGTIATWHKQPGEACTRDELIVDIETDKVVMEVVAPADGSLEEIVMPEGSTVLSNQLIARFSAGAAGTAASSPAPVEEAPTSAADQSDVSGPAVRKLLHENNLNASQITGTGKDGRLLKEDVLNYLKDSAATPAAATAPTQSVEASTGPAHRTSRRVPMTRMRSTIAKRLVSAQNDAAMLTTYNEVDMSPIMALRKQYKAQFEKAHNGTRLGFMSFFVKAAAEALKRFPAVNASLDGNDMVYHAYQDISVAVSTERGLVVPVLRDVEAMSLADIEKGIVGLATQAKEGKLTMEEMQGGTFTITNGGIFGSLLSTPILNPPQTAILGMHTIQDRPVAENGQVVIRPMMYLALSYDHRMIDGKEAVQFLVTIKELLQDPARILLEI